MTTCGLVEYDLRGNLRPCTETATGSRLTPEGELERACLLHTNTAGERLAHAEAEVARLREEKLVWKRRALRAEAYTRGPDIVEVPVPKCPEAPADA